MEQNHGDDNRTDLLGHLVDSHDRITLVLQGDAFKSQYQQ